VELNSLRVGLTLDDVRFNAVPALRWNQIKNSINTKKIDTLSRMEDVFRRAGNLDEQNEVMYQRRVRESDDKKGWSAFVDSIDYWFWGYRIRPLRVLFWMLVSYFFFAAAYWFQTKPLARDFGRWRGLLNRLKFCLKFSWLTSFKVGYGYQHSRTTFFKFLTSSHSLSFKLMLVCLLIVLSNTSPILKELFGSLFPL
jgi:hypothetical protein